jgi:hypothetical protein
VELLQPGFVELGEAAHFSLPFSISFGFGQVKESLKKIGWFLVE